MIDLCKIFEVEEGEEFKIRYKDGGITRKYAIKDNRLIVVRDNLLGEAIVVLEVNQLNDISEIIKLPKRKEFTDDELAVLRCMDKKYKWATRDRRYGLTVFENKPKKITNNRGEYWNTSGNWLYLGCFENMFQAITTEDEEPVFIDDYVER